MTNLPIKESDYAHAPLKPLLTVDDLEQLFHVDRRTISRLCKRGLLPLPIKLGGGNRWTSEEISDVLSRLSSARNQRRNHEESLVVAV